VAGPTSFGGPATYHHGQQFAKLRHLLASLQTTRSRVRLGISESCRELQTIGGDLVLQDQGRTVWQTGTTTGVKLVMQNDGHLVLYDAGNGAAWSSGTAGNPGAVLILRADGNMVISLGGRVLFRTGTGG
jgi:hypothetical protein